MTNDHHPMIPRVARPLPRLASVSGQLRRSHTRVELLSEVRKSFPNTEDLHSRIDLLLNNPTKVVRVALIPFHVHRNAIKGVLDAVVADPLSRNLEWYDALRNRLLGKNTSVTYNPTFDKNIITHNSLVEYAVPFAVPSHESFVHKGSTITDPRHVEILEVNSYKDSLDHLRSCHRHIYICNDVRTANTKPLPPNYPADLYLDMAGGVNVVSDHVKLIDSELAMKGNELLRESPANASEYAEKYNESSIAQVQHSVFGRDLAASEAAVLETIVTTCKDIVSREEEVEYEISNESFSVCKRREQWASEAHLELQTTYTKALQDLVQNKLAWWKLYYKVDEVHQQVSETLLYYFLPRTQDRFDYLLGRIDQFAEKHHFPPLPTAGISKTEQISALFRNARDSIISDLAVDLHNTALRELLKNLLGVQLPLIVLPLLGVYFFDYSLYGAGSIMALGVVVGASRLEKAWKKATTKFTSAALDRARLTVEECDRGIWERWDAQVKNQQEGSASRKRLIELLEEK